MKCSLWCSTGVLAAMLAALLPSAVGAQEPPRPVVPDTVRFSPPVPDSEIPTRSVPNWTSPVIERAFDHRRFIAPPPPANTSEYTALEIEELNALAATRNDPTVREIILRWNDDPPGSFYNEYFTYLFQTSRIAGRPFFPAEAGRCRALLNEAIWTTMLAHWISKYTYLRPRPDQITGFSFAPDVDMPTPNDPSYPAGHSAIAGSFVAIGQFCFPEEDPNIFLSLAREASLARRQGGVHYFADSVVGEALGYTVASALANLYRNDGSTFSDNPAPPVYSRPPSFDQFGIPRTTLRRTPPPSPLKNPDGTPLTLPLPNPPAVQSPPAAVVPIPSVEPR